MKKLEEAMHDGSRSSITLICELVVMLIQVVMLIVCVILHCTLVELLI